MVLIYPTAYTGSITVSASQTVYVNLGFRPRYLCMTSESPGGLGGCTIYNADISTTKAIYTNGDSNAIYYNLPASDSENYRIKSIDSTGFTVNRFPNTAWGANARYFAMK